MVAVARIVGAVLEERRTACLIGVVIGIAFGAIVTSLVNDIIMPIIGAITGGLDFSNYYLALSSKVQYGQAYADAKKQGAVLGFGQFTPWRSTSSSSPSCSSWWCAA